MVRYRQLWNAAGLLVFVACVIGSCNGQPTAPSPTPDPALQVTPLDSAGPIRITFVKANIVPGSTVVGCGTRIEGCAGRLRLTFRLDPSSDGPVLYARVYLHATNLQACLWGEIEPFTVRAGDALTIEIPTDRADSCGTPATIATMAVVVEGPIQVSSRQTWSLHYTFAP
jgi:hypothetical protein